MRVCEGLPLSFEESDVLHKFWGNVDKYKNYDCLDNRESRIIRNIYRRQLDKLYPGWMKNKLKCPIRTMYGDSLLSDYNKIIVGNHGPYVEFERNHLLVKIICKPGEEYRECVEFNGKYHYKQPIINNTIEDIKI